MKPAPFEYHRPGTVEEALAVLARHSGDAKPLAGGQSLIPAMNFRLARPAVLVDLNRIPALAGIRGSADGLRIGAMTRQRAVERDATVARDAPLVAEALPHIAHPQIRTRGTVGGSLAHADPAAELPAVMVAHVSFPAADRNPASLSSWWINDQLRGVLGFTGAVITDDVSMVGAAVVGPVEQRVRLALDAGCDLVLLCNSPEQVPVVLESLKGFVNPSAQLRLTRLHGRGGWLRRAEVPTSQIRCVGGR